MEGKNQRAIRNIKSKLSRDKYNKIYLTCCAPSKIYRTEKIYKTVENDSIRNFSLLQIISTIGTTSYHLAEHLAMLSASLRRSDIIVRKENLKTCLPRWLQTDFI